ncbi:MAG TPA: zinc ABC transporter substrate-binding protein, partial [Acidimicrobiales bacterium]|nr:zinc ABC transporter substrate-binding protein [Acidimicrobiales bacterium]
MTGVEAAGARNPCPAGPAAPVRSGGTGPRSRRTSVAVVLLVLVVFLAGCTSSPVGTRSGPGGRISVVAAENFWGSIAKQVGGDRVAVTSIITNPETDPHSYEATAQDGRSFATAQFVIVNGVGYDP